MMNNYKTTFIHTGIWIILLVFSSSLLHAQNDPFARNYTLDTNDSRHITQVYRTHKQLFNEQRYYEILSFLSKEFENENYIWTDTTNLAEKSKALKAFNSFLSKLDSISSSSPDDLSAIAGGFFRIKPPTISGKPLRFFENEFEILVTDSALTHEAAIDLRYRMHTAQSVLDSLTQEGRLILEKDLRELNKDWENFHFNGKAQYPWEFLANSLLLSNKRPLVKPPKRQLVLLHPNISFELNANDIDAIKANQVFSIEVLGAAWNFNDYTDNLAVSGVVSFSNNLGNGYGGMVTWNDTQFGLIRHTNTKQTNLIITLDLLKLVQKGKTQWENIREQ